MSQRTFRPAFESTNRTEQFWGGRTVQPLMGLGCHKMKMFLGWIVKCCMVWIEVSHCLKGTDWLMIREQRFRMSKNSMEPKHFLGGRDKCNFYNYIIVFQNVLHRGLYFGPKTIFIPPLLKMIFFPISWHIVFLLPLWPFCLNSSLFCIYFTLWLPLFSFSSPFFIFLFPFLLFLLHFPPFSLQLFKIFPQNDIGWYSPWGGYFPIYRPLVLHIHWLSVRLLIILHN
jgi:hypothetical protein